MTNKVDLNNIPENFVITYYAKKHGKIITRNGQWTKPDDFMTTHNMEALQRLNICRQKKLIFLPHNVVHV